MQMLYISVRTRFRDGQLRRRTRSYLRRLIQRGGTARLTCALLLVLMIGAPVRTDNSCRATPPPVPAFIPPAPYSPAPLGDHAFLVGTNDLWVGVWNQPWQGLRHKVWWWRPGFDGAGEQSPALAILLREVSSNIAVALNTPATNGSFDGESKMLVGIDFPTPGCWQVTGTYGGHTLSFVTEVK
jgi:hypothetical protein